MTTISKDAKLLTLINVFTVDPANQRRLVDLLVRATETSVRLPTWKSLPSWCLVAKIDDAIPPRCGANVRAAYHLHVQRP